MTRDDESSTPAATVSEREPAVSATDDIDAWFRAVYGISCPITPALRGPLVHDGALHWRSAVVPSTFKFSTRPLWHRGAEDFVHTVVWGGGQGGSNHSWTQQRGRVFVSLRWWVRGTSESQRHDRREMECCLRVAAAMFTMPVAVEAAALIADLGRATLCVVTRAGRVGHIVVGLEKAALPLIARVLAGDETGLAFGPDPSGTEAAARSERE